MIRSPKQISQNKDKCYQNFHREGELDPMKLLRQFYQPLVLNKHGSSVQH